jgi:hypothetical protein
MSSIKYHKLSASFVLSKLTSLALNITTEPRAMTQALALHLAGSGSIPRPVHTIYGGQNDTPSASVFPSQHHSTSAPFAFTHPSTTQHHLAIYSVGSSVIIRRDYGQHSRDSKQRNGLVFKERKVQEDISLSRIFGNRLQCDMASHPWRTKASSTQLRRGKKRNWQCR